MTAALVVARREYWTRVRTKAFWISTVALPILMGVWVVAPGLLVAGTRGELRLALVDETGTVAPAIAAELAGRSDASQGLLRVRLEVVPPGDDPAAVAAALDRRVEADELDAWLRVSSAGLARNRIEYRAAAVSNLLTQQLLAENVSRAVRAERLAAAGYEPAAIADLSRRIELAPVRVTARGSGPGGVGDIALAVGLFMVLYLSMVIYGQIVMQGVIEEKSSRVVEVVLAAVTPFQLMSGKLLGICAVSLTQLGLWLGCFVALSAPGALAFFALLPGPVTLPQLAPTLVLHFLAHFLLGYALYASFYALLGAAFESPQEAQHLAGLGAVLMVAPWLLFIPVLDDPSSTLAVVTSLLPPFTPLLMMLRLATKPPPWWQLALGYLLTAGAAVAMLGACARVYRVGILMLGKKPTVRELWRWLRYA